MWKKAPHYCAFLTSLWCHWTKALMDVIMIDDWESAGTAVILVSQLQYVKMMHGSQWQAVRIIHYPLHLAISGSETMSMIGFTEIVSRLSLERGWESSHEQPLMTEKRLCNSHNFICKLMTCINIWTWPSVITSYMQYLLVSVYLGLLLPGITSGPDWTNHVGQPWVSGSHMASRLYMHPEWPLVCGAFFHALNGIIFLSKCDIFIKQWQHCTYQ